MTRTVSVLVVLVLAVAYVTALSPVETCRASCAVRKGEYKDDSVCKDYKFARPAPRVGRICDKAHRTVFDIACRLGCDLPEQCGRLSATNEYLEPHLTAHCKPMLNMLPRPLSYKACKTGVLEGAKMEHDEIDGLNDGELEARRMAEEAEAKREQRRKEEAAIAAERARIEAEKQKEAAAAAEKAAAERAAAAEEARRVEEARLAEVAAAAQAEEDARLAAEAEAEADAAAAAQAQADAEAAAIAQARANAEAQAIADARAAADAAEAAKAAEATP